MAENIINIRVWRVGITYDYGMNIEKVTKLYDIEIGVHGWVFHFGTCVGLSGK